MTIKEALIFSNNKLKYLDPYFLEGEILLSFILKKPKEYLYAHPEQKLTEAQLKNFKKLIGRRLKKEPIAYLIKQKEFYGLNFYVDKNVLIPRPETELIIDEVLRIANCELRIAICDIGTGSGCIAVTLAKLLAKAKITAIDIYPSALKIAKKNAKINGVLKNIQFKKSNLFSKLKNYKFEIIVANLPYLTKKELTNVPYEPRQALFGGKNGLEIIEKFLSQAKNILKPDSIILLEISPTQLNNIKKLVKKYLPDKKIKFIKDLNNKTRLIKIR